MIDPNIMRVVEAFTNATVGFDELSTAFRKVSDVLLGSPEIGESSSLWSEWDDIRQRWRVALKSSRDNAHGCEGFLRRQAIVIASLSYPPLQVAITPQDGLRIVDTFLKEIPDYILSASSVSAEFEKILEQVGRFPHKVREYLKAQKGFWQKLWEFIQTFCREIVDRIDKFFESLFDAFKPYIRLVECIPLGDSKYSIEFVSRHPRGNEGHAIPGAFNLYSMDLDEERRVQHHCHQIKTYLSFETILWREIELCCKDLKSTIANGRAFLDYPYISQPLMNSTHPLFQILVECLHAYAAGQAPPAHAGTPFTGGRPC